MKFKSGASLRSKAMSKLFLLSVGVATLGAPLADAQELIVNGGFEINPPPNLGNNIGHPITPWIVTGTSNTNVVKVDGPGGFLYARPSDGRPSGPESDQTAPGAGIDQHYLDIVGTNDFFQSFTVPACPNGAATTTGRYLVEGYFSTRDNFSGSGNIRLHEGPNISGPELPGSRQAASLPGNSTATEPLWTRVGTVVDLTIGDTFSFGVTVTQNINFDNGSVVLQAVACPNLDIVKSTTTAPTAAGQTLDYEFAVTNTSLVIGTAGNITVSDVVLNDPKCAATPTLISSSNGTLDAILAPNETQIYQCTSIPVTQAEVDARQVDNTITVTGTPDEGSFSVPQTGFNSTPVVVDIQAAPETFALVDGGAGGTTSSVLASDTLDGQPITDPSDVTISLVSSTGGLTLDPVTNGIVVPAGTPVGSFTLTYEICDALDPTNCTTVTETVDVGAGGIGIVKSSIFDDQNGDGFAQVGETITYSYTVTNTGDFPLSPVTVVETGFTGAGPTPTPLLASGDNGDGVLQATETFVFTATYALLQADIDAGSVDNSATAQANTPGGAPVSDISDSANPGDGNGTGTPGGGVGNDETTTTSLANTPILAQDDVVPDPVDATNDLTAVVNVLAGNGNGPDTLNGVPATSATVFARPDPANPLPAGFTLNPDGTVDIAAGTAPADYTFGYEICEIGNSSNCDTATVTITVGAGGIGVLKVATFNDESGDGNAQVGETITYTYTVTNEGNLPLSGITLTETGFGGAGATPVPTLTGGDANGDTLLQPTEIFTYTATYTLLAADVTAGSVQNQATAAGTQPGGTRISDLSDDDTPGGTGTAGPGAGNDDPTVTPLASAVIVANDDVLAAPIDATTAQTNVLNVFDDNGNGPDTLDGAPTDENAAEVTIVPTGPTPPGITLNPDGSVDVAAGTAPGSFTFQYQICEILNPANCDTAEVSLTVGEGALGVVKTSVFNDESGDGNGQVGETIDYTYLVSNIGDFDLSNPTLVETGFTGTGPLPVPVLVSGDDGDGVLELDEVFVYTATYALTADDLLAGMVDNQATGSGTTPGGTTVSDLSDSTNPGDGNGVGTPGGGPGNNNTTSTPFTVSTIAANDDVLADPVDAFVAQPAVLNVLTPTGAGDADTLNGAQATVATVDIAVLTPAVSIGGGPVPVLNIATGDVDVPAGTPPGSYTIAYEICEAGNPNNCDTATAEITVGGSGIGILKSSVFNDENFDNAAQVGETISYTYTVSNQGDLPLSGISVTEPAAGFTGAGTPPVPVFVRGDDGDDVLQVGETWFYSATYTLVAADITAGGVTNLAAASGTTPAGQIVTDQSDSQNPGDGDGLATPGDGVGNDDPTVTPLLSAPIVAQDDAATGVDGFAGSPAVLNILTDNGAGADTLNGTPTSVSRVNISVLTPATSIGGGPVPVLNPATGDVDVPPGTPAGSYVISYEICETANPENCDTAMVTVEVSSPVIDAMDNDFTALPFDGADGDTTPSVFGNDTVNGAPFAPANVVPSILDDGGLTGVTINPDGTLTIPPGTPAGTFNVVYEICDVANPTVCDTAIASIRVGTIEAVAEIFPPIEGAVGGLTPSVLTSDTLNGAPITDPASVTLTVLGSTGGLTLDPATNGIIVPAGTPPGTFTLTYEICDAMNAGICATVTETVVVAAISAVAENFAPTPAGTSTTLSVLQSDTLNGQPATLATVSLTLLSADAPLTLNPDGTIAVAAGTPAGTFVLTYEICDLANPTICSSITETVEVPAEPELTVLKTQILVDNGDGVAGVGDRLDYTITVANTGNIALDTVTLTDTFTDGDGAVLALDSGPTFVSASAGSPEGALAIDETATFTASFTVTAPVVTSGETSNTVLAQGAPIRPAGFVGAIPLSVQDISDEGNPADGDDNPTVFPFAAQPFNDGLSVVKTAAISRVIRGGTVPYTLRVTNSNATVSVGAVAVDTLPAGFVFVDGTASIDGVPTTLVDVAGRVVTFPTVSVPPGGEVLITLSARVLTGASAGPAVNRADLLNPLTGASIAPSGTATVFVEPEAVFDCGDVIGKVYDDRNGNGYQDQGEPGLPAVRIAGVDGTIITTDQFGRYHVPCAALPESRGTNFILKVDERSLPTGYRLTTENPRVIRLTRGKLSEMNFGASISRIVRVDVNPRVFGLAADGSMQLVPAFQSGVEGLLERIKDSPSTIRLAFHLPDGATQAQRNTAQGMARDVRRYIEGRWRRIGDYRLNIETTFVKSN